MKLFFLFLLSSSLLFSSEIRIETYVGEEIASHVAEMKKLCDKIHCESSHLYNGHDMGYDTYIQGFSKIKEAVVALAYDDKKCVGFAAGLPLVKTNELYQKPLEESAHDIDSLFFIGEFGLRPEYQNKGIEEKLYQKIEHYAKEKDTYSMICFWEIEDTSNPTQKPPGMVMRDAFWKKLGFVRYPKLHFLVFWQNKQETVESPHLAIYWTKKL